MDKPLTRIKNVLYHYNSNGELTAGKNPNMTGDCSGLWGNCSDLEGDCSDLEGNCSGLEGDCSGLGGNCSGLEGNLDKVPMEGRNDKPNLTDWIQEKE